MNLERAFKYPFTDKNWIIKTLLGGIILIIPILNFVLFGFVYKILKDIKENRQGDTLPDFSEFAELFTKGLPLVAIIGAYTFLFILFWGIVILLGLIPIIGCLAIILWPVLILTLVVFPDLLGIALCRFTEHGDISEAFNMKSIFEEFKKKANDYIILAVLNLLVSLVISVTFCFAPFLFFISTIIFSKLYAETYWSVK